jgi:hypothetical protein
MDYTRFCTGFHSLRGIGKPLPKRIGCGVAGGGI